MIDELGREPRDLRIPGSFDRLTSKCDVTKYPKLRAADVDYLERAGNINPLPFLKDRVSKQMTEKPAVRAAVAQDKLPLRKKGSCVRLRSHTSASWILATKPGNGIVLLSRRRSGLRHESRRSFQRTRHHRQVLTSVAPDFQRPPRLD